MMRKVVFSLLVCVALVVVIQPVVAAGLLDTVKEGGLDTVGKAYGQTDEPTDIRVVVARIINVLLGFLGIIFTALVVYAGFQWMTSSGDSSKIGEAKKRITAGIVGLLIIAISWGLSSYLTGCIWHITTDSIFGTCS